MATKTTTKKRTRSSAKQQKQTMLLLGAVALAGVGFFMWQRSKANDDDPNNVTQRLLDLDLSGYTRPAPSKPVSFGVSWSNSWLDWLTGSNKKHPMPSSGLDVGLSVAAPSILTTYDKPMRFGVGL